MSLSNIQAQVQDILFDKGSTLTKTYYKITKSSSGVYSAPDLSLYTATLTARLLYSDALPLWSFASDDPSPVISIVTISGTDLATSTGLPLEALTTIYGVQIEIPDTETEIIDWKPQVRLPLTGLYYDSAVYDIELYASGQPTFKIIKGRLYAAEEVTKV
jgi:hypothetical protein